MPSDTKPSDTDGVVKMNPKGFDTNYWYDGDARDFWAEYMKGRPMVPQQFFERIYQYHNDHGGEFNVVNDVGAGPGNLSRFLALQFCEVIVTEPNDLTLQTAREWLSKDPSASKYRFVQESLENKHEPDGSVDMVFAANVMHWTKLEKSMPVVAAQLKSGGTFAVGGFGLMALMNPHAQKMLKTIYGDVIMSMLEHKIYALEDMVEVMRIQDSAYDAIPLSKEYFRPGAQRIRFNFRSDEEFVVAAEISHPEKGIKRAIAEDEQTFSIEDRDWCFETDIQGLKDNLASMPLKIEQDKLERFFNELEELSDNGKFQAYWPVILILASKK